MYGRHLVCMEGIWFVWLASTLYGRHLVCMASIRLYASPWQPASGLNPEKFGDRSPGSSGAHSARG